MCFVILGALRWEGPGLDLEVDFAPVDLGDLLPPLHRQDQQLGIGAAIFEPEPDCALGMAYVDRRDRNFASQASRAVRFSSSYL